MNHSSCWFSVFFHIFFCHSFLCVSLFSPQCMVSKIHILINDNLLNRKVLICSFFPLSQKTQANLMITLLQDNSSFPTLSCPFQFKIRRASLHEPFHPLSKLFLSLHFFFLELSTSSSFSRVKGFPYRIWGHSLITDFLSLGSLPSG